MGLGVVIDCNLEDLCHDFAVHVGCHPRQLIHLHVDHGLPLMFFDICL